jgi:pilus assembly protein CpaF
LFPPAQRGSTEWSNLKIRIHGRLLEEVKIERLFDNSERARSDLRGEVLRILAEGNGHFSWVNKQALAEEVVEELAGLGPLEPLMEDPAVSDILVTTPDMVYVERAGRLFETGVRFKNDDHLLRIIEKIVSRVGRRIDETSPLVDARLPDGSRVNAVVSPVAVDGPLLSIRRFGKDKLTPEQLTKNLTLTEGMLELLQACVKARLNILVSGGTGAGKTTLLNILSGYIPESERIVTIEDAAELQLRQRHVARLETRPPNMDGQGAIRIRQLVINALRMRPDRIIVGEVRGEEALDMLQAMNTGHDGSLTTVHANAPRDLLARLEVMVGMANANMPLRAIRQQMSSALDLIVQISRLTDGTRKVTHITEVCGMEGELVTTQDLFVFEKSGIGDNGRVRGRFRATGIRPKFSERLETAGVQLAPSLFQTVLELR